MRCDFICFLIFQAFFSSYLLPHALQKNLLVSLPYAPPHQVGAHCGEYMALLKAKYGLVYCHFFKEALSNQECTWHFNTHLNLSYFFYFIFMVVGYKLLLSIRRMFCGFTITLFHYFISRIQTLTSTWRLRKELPSKYSWWRWSIYQYPAVLIYMATWKILFNFLPKIFILNLLQLTIRMRSYSCKDSFNKWFLNSWPTVE
jgi:hypothetical protein